MVVWVSDWATLLIIFHFELVWGIALLWVYGWKEQAETLAELGAIFMAGTIIGGMVW